MNSLDEASIKQSVRDLFAVTGVLTARITRLETAVGLPPEGSADERSQLALDIAALRAVLQTFAGTIESWLRAGRVRTQ